MANALVCGKCGNTIASDLLQADFGGTCPWCLAAFALGDPPQDDPASTPLVPCAKASDRLGKYLLTEKLGTGGMGEVWKALDTELNRWVALKFLRDQDPKDLARFTREAHMAAKLSHPNIAAVHEIGEVGGRHYIAMQCIEGRTLESFPTNDRRLLVRLCLDAARALDHAHRHGVIHRDVKPGNLMVEETEEGMKVVVLDFGLARSIEGGEKLSMSGSVVGTPQYLSPEQARVERLDERTDVYSLGATMYELFTGKAPFEGANVYEILKKIENEEPIAPRKINPQINQDLQTIILKCLEKNRERRYADAKDLAYDLRRFLNHEAVLARPPSTIYRLRMKLAKRKAVVATAAIASVALVAALSWWLVVGGPGAEHHRLMASGMKLWDEARVSAVTGGDPADIREKAKAAREGFERAIQAREESEAHMMRGRCLELEGQDKEALKALERAYELDPGNEEARVELAKAICLNYQDSRGMPMTLTQNRPGASLVAPKFYDLPRETDKQGKLRERGEKLLAEGKVAPAQENLLNGLLAMGQGKYSQAAGELAVYTKAARWDAQALRLEGLCKYYASDFPGAIAAFDHSLSRVPHALGFNWRGMVKSVTGFHDEAIADYMKAIELDPKCGEAYLNRGNAKMDKGLHDAAIADYTEAINLDPKRAASFLNRGGATKSKGLLDAAIADFTEAIKLDPNFALAYKDRGNAKMDKGLHDAAIADFTEALKLDPKLGAAYNHRGALKCDFKGLYDEAIADLIEAIKLDSNDATAYYNLGNAKSAKGLHDAAIADYDAAIGLDPKFALAFYNRGNSKGAKGLRDDAIADFTKAIELDPTIAGAWNNRGTARRAKGLHDEAISDFTKAIGLDPKNAVIHYNRGTSKAAKGLLDEAISDYNEAIRLNPNYAKAFTERGSAKSRKGLHDEAISDCNEAIKLAPKLAEAYGNRGNAKGAKGLHDEAIADYDVVIKLCPKDALAYYHRGNAKKSKGLNDAAIADYDQSIEFNPKFAPAFCNRGIAKRAKDLPDEAIADYDEAIRLDPKFANAYSSRGNAKSDKGLHDAAIADHDQAINLDPKNASHRFNRGVAKVAMGLPDEAIADYDEAIKLDPNFGAAYYNRGILKSDKGLYDEAISDFTKAIEVDPKDAEAYVKRAKAKSAKGLKDAVIADCTEAIKLVPDNEEAFSSRGNARLAQGLYFEAIADYTVAIRLAPNYEDNYANRAHAKASLGLLDEAIADYKKALEVAPPECSFRTDIERRLAEIDAPGARDPKLKATWQSYGRSTRLIFEKKYAEAIEGFRKIAGEFPKMQIGVDSAYSIACGYALLGEKKNALDWLEKAVEMGWKNVAHLEKDSDLESLRAEGRYRQLVERLKSK